MDKLRASLRQVEEEEQITLRERTGELASTARLQVIAISIRGVMIAVIFVGFWALSRELLRAAARAAAAARMAELGSLATGLGHDLANLFMPLRAHSDALAASPSLSEEDRGSVKAIGSVVAYLSDLSRGLRMVARNPDTKGSGAHTQLSVWCKGACAVFKSAVPGTIALNCRTEDGLPEVDIEPHRLTQAVLNLVNNARNAIVGARGDRPQGRIEVLARRGPEQGVVLITVRDDGPGMSREARSRWGRGGFSTTPGGTGLGLAMVQSIVREAGGSIQIESREDQGTAVTLSVPAVVGQ